MKKRQIAIIVAMVLLVCVSVGATIAYFTDKTDPVKNTFTIGNIDIDLGETTGDKYKMVPGTELPKDPEVTVEADSEDCWLFVKVDKENDPDKYLDYSIDIDSGWIAGTGTGEGKNGVPVGVYFRQVTKDDEDQVFSVLTGDKVAVKETVTKAMMDALEESGDLPTLTFTAYACQQAGGFDTAALAWAEIIK